MRRLWPPDDNVFWALHIIDLVHRWRRTGKGLIPHRVRRQPRVTRVHVLTRLELRLHGLPLIEAAIHAARIAEVVKRLRLPARCAVRLVGIRSRLVEVLSTAA